MSSRLGAFHLFNKIYPEFI